MSKADPCILVIFGASGDHGAQVDPRAVRDAHTRQLAGGIPCAWGLASREDG